ncbi:MAG: 30S ribosomal protein S24e [Candidatus Bathyarchaeia archaeon]
MKIKILSKKYNPLLKRKEVVFEVNHSEEGQTSSRLELRKNLANMLKTKVDLVLVKKVETKTGTMTALGEANVYETPEQAKLIEPKHIIARNIPPEKPAEKEKPKTEEPKEKKPTKEKPEEAERKEEKEAKEAETTSKPEEEKKE